MYAIHWIGYARNLRQGVRALLSSARDAGAMELPFTDALPQGEGLTALTGAGDNPLGPRDPTHPRSERIAFWQPPEALPPLPGCASRTGLSRTRSRA